MCLENHYKVGDWLYPEFAQQEEPFLALLDALPESPHFGVQYDPSNAVVGGFDPIAFLEKIKHRVVTMHASDRFLVPGTTLAEIQLQDGTVGYPDKLKHGETGQGTNDYDAIFRILRSVNFSGWISVEDGMNGLDELARSVDVPEGQAAGALRRVVIVLHRRSGEKETTGGQEIRSRHATIRVPSIDSLDLLISCNPPTS